MGKNTHARTFFLSQHISQNITNRVVIVIFGPLAFRIIAYNFKKCHNTS